MDERGGGHIGESVTRGDFAKVSVVKMGGVSMQWMWAHRYEGSGTEGRVQDMPVYPSIYHVSMPLVKRKMS